MGHITTMTSNARINQDLNITFAALATAAKNCGDAQSGSKSGADARMPIRSARAAPIYLAEAQDASKDMPYTENKLNNVLLVEKLAIGTMSRSDIESGCGRRFRRSRNSSRDSSPSMRGARFAPDSYQCFAFHERRHLLEDYSTLHEWVREQIMPVQAV